MTDIRRCETCYVMDPAACPPLEHEISSSNRDVWELSDNAQQIDSALQGFQASPCLFLFLSHVLIGTLENEKWEKMFTNVIFDANK